MHNYYTAAFFAWSGFMFAVGIGVGQLLCVKRRHGKATIGIEPVVSERWEAIKLMAWTMAIVMFLSVMYYSLIFSYDQRKCNNQLIAVQQYRAKLADSDRDLGDARDKALADMVNSLVIGPTGNGQGIAILKAYQDTIDKINTASAANDKGRSDNPIPKCDEG